jgi:Coenzyme PQQ synthesis protein D (PqqD)
LAEDLLFKGLAAPLRLTDAAALRPILNKVSQAWPYRVLPADPARHPFFTITGLPGPSRFRCENHVEPAPPRDWNAVNAACDAMAALAQALGAEDPSVVCLHAAAVAMAGRLVVFPNLRRAGKSTLAAGLAQAGHVVFSDDVLPLGLAANGVAFGRAMGLAPRLRLPLPDNVSQNFRDWVAHHAGPENRQYSYLALPDLPAHGETLPVGAFVILDRREEAVAPQLVPVGPDQAMDVLLQQNFTRDRHSGDVLTSMATVLSGLPVFRLTYCDMEPAVACLGAQFARWPADAPCPDGAAVPFRHADLTSHWPEPPANRPLQQRDGTITREIGETLYLADAEGRAIHRMDALAAAIWDLLAAPFHPDELLATLSAALPGVEADRLANDLDALLERFRREGLVTAV